ncbi:MAG: hypothetical protein ACFCA4_15955, partial [Cyanophyceae cyanobacterium]
MTTVFDGATSVFIDAAVLGGAGLQLTGSSGTATPAAANFPVAFDITEASTLTLQPDGQVQSGSIEHTGTVTFNGALTLGNFSVQFDQTRVDATTGASGFFLADNLLTRSPVFDLGNVNLSASGTDFTATNADLLVAPEVAGLLGNPALAGSDAGDAQINAVLRSAVGAPATPPAAPPAEPPPAAPPAEPPAAPPAAPPAEPPAAPPAAPPTSDPS